MKVLLIQPECNYPSPVAVPSQALLTLGTLAQNIGCSVKILHLGLDERPLFLYLIDFKPDIVGITVNTFQVASAKLIIETVRSINPYTRIVIGGPHSEYLDDAVDDKVIGEGENRWLAILGSQESIELINQLPTINYDLVDMQKFPGVPPIGAIPSASIMASRGCPSRCSYCNTPIFVGTKVRLGNPDYILGELKRLNEKWGVKEVVFQDDTFNASTKWATEILERIIKVGLNKEMIFRLVWRVNEKLVTQELLNLAKRAGVWHIYYGVESGSQRMLDRMNKRITIKEIKRAFSMTHEVGLQTHASFIVGLPGETWDSIKETQQLISQIKSTTFSWCYFIPFPGTEATKEVTEKGYIRETDYSEYGVGKLFARTDALSFEDLESFKGYTK